MQLRTKQLKCSRENETSTLHFLCFFLVLQNKIRFLWSLNGQKKHKVDLDCGELKGNWKEGLIWSNSHSWSWIT